MNTNITMKLVCVFFLSCVTTGNASSFMDEDGGSAFAIPHHRELERELDECTELKNGEACPPGESNPGFGSYCSVARVDNQCVAEYCSKNEQCQSESCVSNECRDASYCNGDGGANNIVNCNCGDPDPFFLENFGNDNINCYSAAGYNQMACGGCDGSCAGTDYCLNLDFHCAEGQACELSCTGGNSCKGVTMYCPDNQVCAMTTCGDGTERCVGAKVICGSGTIAVDDFTCEPLIYKYEILVSFNYIFPSHDFCLLTLSISTNNNLNLSLILNQNLCMLLNHSLC